MSLPLADYALIGDCETAALVGRDGSIDWLCWPRFDSDACFAALLGTSDHGRWLIGPADPACARAVSRRYRGESLILETRFECATGAVTVIDLMPPRDNGSNIVRIVVGEHGTVQIMYGLAGERRLTEFEIPELPGYENSRPVRHGNAAHGQLQLDAYGEVMDALYQAHHAGVPSSPVAWAMQVNFLTHLETIWQEPDRGIWESRGEPRHYTYSKVMAWVAFDRDIKLATEAGLDGPVARWTTIASKPCAQICAQGFDATLGTFTQAYGSKTLDGSQLLIPTTGFLPVSDPRIVGTIAAIEARRVVDGLVMRHDPVEVETGLRHGEGAFLACSFWLVDALEMQDRHDEARALFARRLALRNDLGLLAEEYDVRARRLVGNFPQAFSHVALVSSAQNLMRAAKPVDQRSA